MNENKNPTKTRIQQKIQLIQTEIGSVVRSEENKFLKMKYFNELSILKLIKPLLEKYKLALVLSDDREKFSYKKEGNQYEVSYLKHAIFYDTEDDNAKDSKNVMPVSFWACGSNVNLSQAKGSAETYAMKYFLSKFFLIPVRDENDPDFFMKPMNEE